MKITRYIILLIALCGSLSANALSPSELKRARMAAYQWIRDYNTFSYGQGRMGIEKYLSLYESEGMMVVNDYLPSLYRLPATISARQYADLLNECNADTAFYQMFYTITNAKIVDESTNRKVVYFTITLDKSIEFVERNNDDDNKIFAYPPVDYHITVRLLYDIISDRIYAVEMKSDVEVTNAYVLHDEREGETLNRYLTDEELSYMKSKKRAVYESIPQDPQMLLSDGKKTKTGGGGGQKNKVFLGGGAGYTLQKSTWTKGNGMPYPKLKENGPFTQNLLYEGNLGYYRQFVRSGGNALGMELGAEFQVREIGWKLDSTAYNYAFKAKNLEDDEVIQIVSDSSFEEKISSYTVAVPIALRYDYYFNDRVSLFVRVGALGSYDIKQKTTTKARVEYSEKDELFPSVPSFSIDLTPMGYGTYDLKENAKNIALDKWNVEVFGGLGVQIFFAPQWSMDISAQYNYLVFNKIKTLNEEWYLTKVAGKLGTPKHEWTSATNWLKKLQAQRVELKIQFNYHF